VRVYIAGPITKGNQFVNVREAILAGDRVREAGHVPFVPHLNALWELISPRPYQDWLTMDFAWISQCEALIRLPGESHGADQEVAHAEKVGIPVYHGVEAFVSSVVATRVDCHG